MCETDHVCTPTLTCIRAVPVFKDLTDEEIDLLHDVTKSRQYEKGDYVFREGELSESLYVLRKGLVKISKISENGKEHIIRFMFPGDFFGQFALLQGKQHYANAEVIDSAVVCNINRNDFRSVVEHNPSMAYRFLLAMSERLHQADEWAGALSLLEVERRLAKMLYHFLQKDDSDGKTLRLPAAKKELAAMIGTTPETLSRKLSHFEELKLIRVDRKLIRVLNSEELSRLAGLSS